MNNKVWYNITEEENSNSVEVSIYGAIGSEVDAKQFAEDLKSINSDIIHLRIDSPGGCVISGNNIFNAIKRHPAKIITHIDGLAASMGSVIAMAGDEVMMADNALFMIHNPWTVSMGDSEELRKSADLLDKMSQSILNSYSRSQYEPEELKDLMDAETWFTAQEALDAGFVDSIEGGIRVAALALNETAEIGGIKIPHDKQVFAFERQIEALGKINIDLSEKLDSKRQEIVSLSSQLADSRAEVESAELAKYEAEALSKQIETELESKEIELSEKIDELKASKEISENSVAQKAAEILQLSTHSAAAVDVDPREKMTEDQFWAEYNSIQDLSARNDWYTSNKNRKIE